MPDSDYTIDYVGFIHDNAPVTLTHDWRVIRVDGVDLAGAQLDAPMPFAVCSRYELTMDLRIAETQSAGILEFYLRDPFGLPEGPKIGEVPYGIVANPGSGFDGNAIVPVDLIFNVPASRQAYTIQVKVKAGPLIELRQHYSGRGEVHIFYLGSSVDCGAIGPPPPLGVWCEPFAPTNADEADQLEEIHMERMSVLADTF